MGPDLSKIDKLMLALHKKYKLKKVKTDLFLGKQISTLDKGTLKLFQGQYTRKLLERHGLHECKTANTPLERLLEPSDAQSSKQQLTEYCLRSEPPGQIPDQSIGRTFTGSS